MSNSVTHNEAKGQFELTLEGQTSLLQYVRNDNTITLVHTEVPEPLRGRGLSDQLIRAALDFARFNQLKVVPVCSAVQRYLQDHPDVASSIDISS